VFDVLLEHGCIFRHSAEVLGETLDTLFILT
jgi:hypothetical protein